MAKTTAWVFTILGILAIPPVKDWVDTLYQQCGGGW